MPTVKHNDKILEYEEWEKEGIELFGEDKTKWKFKCCNCGNVQSIEDFQKAKIEQPEKKVYFSCIGRWTGGKGELGNKKSPCNYTIGGLINISTLTINRNGDKISAFEFSK
jgi:hypothetical protein